MSDGFQRELKEDDTRLLPGSEWNAVGKPGGAEPEDLGHRLRSLSFILSALESADKFEQWRDTAWLPKVHSGCCAESHGRGKIGHEVPKLSRREISLLMEKTGRQT